MSKTCRDIFDEAIKARGRHNLPSGNYKLREAQLRLVQMQSTIMAIQRHITSGRKIRPQEDLGLCLGEDRAIWLKRVPAAISQTLGYDVLPAVAALSGDGLTEREVRRLVALTRPVIDKLIEHCETARIRISRDVLTEYDAMRHQASPLAKLLDDVLALVASLID